MFLCKSNQKGYLLACAEEFAHWLSGFSDGEGNFHIQEQKNSNSFRFKLELHIDDLSLLHYLKDRTKIGTISQRLKSCTLVVAKREDVLKLFKILDVKPLITTKYLDYIDFKEAFNLNMKRLESNCPQEKTLLAEKILKLKKGMNTNRTDFTMPNNHKIVITPYWFLGFSEGESSFLVTLERGHRFLISQNARQKQVMLAIKEFLISESVCPKDRQPNILLSLTPAKGNVQAWIKLFLTDSLFIDQYLIPFLDKLTFLTAKARDYNDWKTLMELRKRGWHLDDQNRVYYLALINRMNFHRLSTNSEGYLSNENFILHSILEPKISVLLSQSNLELHSNGQIWVKSCQKYLHGIKASIAVYNESKTFQQEFESIRETAKFFEVSPPTIFKRFNNNQPFFFKGENFYFKRKEYKFNYIFSK